MTERLLQFIWQFQYFNSKQLTTAEGESLQVIQPGIYNSNQGPDFTDAKIRLGKTVWAGSIELHICSSGWNNHGHSQDPNFNNVILHVVWEHDTGTGLPFSTLVLQDKVPKILLSRYEELMNTGSFIPCGGNIRQVNTITWVAWKERLLIERLQVKTTGIFKFLAATNNHWEETLWWLMAKNFGAKLNSTAFEAIARSVPFSLVAKHRHQLLQLEALLFGQAGLLETIFEEAYPCTLQREYRFLQQKYKLKPVSTRLVLLRMRPSNFPTIRLAQLAMLLHQCSRLFSLIKESPGPEPVTKMLSVTASEYWNTHYVFGETSRFKKKHTGSQMLRSLLINTVVPLVFAYGLWQHEQAYKDKALRWLEETDAEQNSITDGFASLGVPNTNAFDSQALLQLKNTYCDRKRCLDCAIGNKLLRS
ncbi:MAG TPA: DUF2851 domain-containing protein [Chitinophagaceae bacterium]|nr:DUF2851 domain-containing protein [Chitinophagaceae bacterium]